MGNSNAGTIQLWDVASAPPQRTKLIASAGYIRGMVFSPDELSLVVGSYQSTIIRWDLRASTPVSATLADMTGWPVSAAQLAFSADGTLLAVDRCTSSFDNDGALECTQHDVVEWDLAAGAGVMTALANTTGADVSFDFSASGRRLTVGRCLRREIGTCEGSDLRILDLAAQPPAETMLNGDTQAVSDVTNNADETLVAAITASGGIELSSATTQQITGAPIQVSTLEVSSAAFSPDGTKLAAGHCVHQSMPDVFLECD